MLSLRSSNRSVNILFTLCVFASRELGEPMPDEELKGMIDEFDLDGDGES